MTDTLTAPAPTATENDWTVVGERTLPEQYRDRFLAVLDGTRSGFGSAPEDARLPRWRYPNGSHPMSPGMALQSIVDEFDLRGIRAVSYNLAWEAHDTTGKPGYFGDFTCTYTVLGVQTRRQRLWFLDGGCAITPVLIQSFADDLDAPAAPEGK